MTHVRDLPPFCEPNLHHHNHDVEFYESPARRDDNTSTTAKMGRMHSKGPQNPSEIYDVFYEASNGTDNGT